MEREVVNLMREHGFSCERTLERGARMDGSPTWDIDLVLDKVRKGECKRKKSGFKFIYESLGDNDFLVIREDRAKRLYVVNEETFIEMAKALNENKNNL